MGKLRRGLLGMLLVSMVSLPALAEETDAEGEGTMSSGPSVEYVALEPDIVTNYGTTGRLHFVRVKASIKASSPEAAESVHTHMPFIRDALVMALGDQQPETVHSFEAQQAVRAKALEKINNFLIEEGEPTVDEVLFTEYLAQ